jgi:hypothetical protein
MTAIGAKQTAGIDVKRTLPIAGWNVQMVASK